MADVGVTWSRSLYWSCYFYFAPARSFEVEDLVDWFSKFDCYCLMLSVEAAGSPFFLEEEVWWCWNTVWALLPESRVDRFLFRPRGCCSTLFAPGMTFLEVVRCIVLCWWPLLRRFGLLSLSSAKPSLPTVDIVFFRSLMKEEKDFLLSYFSLKSPLLWPT